MLSLFPASLFVSLLSVFPPVAPFPDSAKHYPVLHVFEIYTMLGLQPVSEGAPAEVPALPTGSTAVITCVCSLCTLPSPTGSLAEGN